MSQDYDVYYQQLLAALAACQEKSATEVEKVEACFKCSLDYWGKIKKRWKTRSFKLLQKRYTSLKISNSIYRLHRILYLPLPCPALHATDDKLELVRFWKWEMRKQKDSLKVMRDSAGICGRVQQKGMKNIFCAPAITVNRWCMADTWRGSRDGNAGRLPGYDDRAYGMYQTFIRKRWRT